MRKVRNSLEGVIMKKSINPQSMCKVSSDITVFEIVVGILIYKNNRRDGLRRRSMKEVGRAIFPLAARPVVAHLTPGPSQRTP